MILRLCEKDKPDKVSKSGAKNLIPDTGRTEIPVKRERRTTNVKRERLPASESEWQHSTLRSRKKHQECKDLQGNPALTPYLQRHNVNRIRSYANNGKPWKPEWQRTAFIPTYFHWEQWKYVYRTSISIDWWFEYFGRKWVNLKSVTGWKVETRALRQQVEKSNEQSFEIITWNNAEIVKKQFCKKLQTSPDPVR